MDLSLLKRAVPLSDIELCSFNPKYEEIISTVEIEH